MHPRAQLLIHQLQLSPHPEGGYYREVHRSGLQVTRRSDGATRCGMTAIYFLLLGGCPSRWHRVSSDEIWHFCEGAPLELSTGEFPGDDAAITLLGPLCAASAPLRVVPAGTWQKAATTGDYTLVACTVGPGFEFADFEVEAQAPEV